MSGIKICNVKTIINGQWSKNEAISNKITDIINSSDGRHFSFTNEIKIYFISNNRMYTVIYRENIEITREKIINRQDVRFAIDQPVPPRI